MNLTPITQPKPSPKFQVCDIETMNWTKFIVLGYYDGNIYLEFRSLKKFLAHIKNKPEQNIFAHFGGKFDFLFILEEVLKDPSLQVQNIIPRGSSILGLEIICNGNKINFRDSAALLPFSLKSITENFGTETVKGDWDHSKTKGYSKGLSKYLKSDCISLYQSLEKFYAWPLIQASGPAYTMASQAMKVFRTFIKEPIQNLPKNSTAFCRQAYLGGRVEIFKPIFKGANNEKLFEYDVNSLYPSVMRDMAFPVDSGYGTFGRNKSRLGIYEASVVAPEGLHIPTLGVIQDAKYIFPVGRFSGHWTGAEIDYAETLGYKIKIIRGHEFKTKKYLFKGYVEALYDIRKTSPPNSVSNVLAKLLMNSLYGRFGMNLNRENISFELKEGNKEYETIKIGKKRIQLFKEPCEIDSFTNVAIAAHVTSYARIHMHRLMQQCDGELFYTDTDSLFTTRDFPDSKNLGDLKRECSYDSACFLLPKTYIATGKMKTKIAMKGFDKKKIQNFTFEDFTMAFQGDLKRMKVTSEPKFATLKSALAQKKLVTMTKASDKQLRSLYTKRIILKNGETKPITLEE